MDSSLYSYLAACCRQLLAASSLTCKLPFLSSFIGNKCVFSVDDDFWGHHGVKTPRVRQGVSNILQVFRIQFLVTCFSWIKLETKRTNAYDNICNPVQFIAFCVLLVTSFKQSFFNKISWGMSHEILLKNDCLNDVTRSTQNAMNCTGLQILS